MKTYRTGEPARYGLYIASRPLDMTFVGAEGEALDGVKGATYRRVPSLLALVMAPVLGGAFVTVFPLVVIVTVAGVAGHWVGTRAAEAARRHANLAGVRWEPVASYLHRPEEGEQESTETGEKDEEMAELEAEVRERREAEEEPAE